MDNSYCLYMHTCPNGKRYIGVTLRSPENRWRNGKGYSRQVFGNAVEKYGWDNIRHEVLMEGLSKEKAEAMERLHIAIFRTADSRFGYNLESGGNLGKEVSEESRRKRSESMKGKRTGVDNPMYRRPVSEETRKKLSKASKGRTLSEEAREKIRQSLKGRKPNEETRKKWSEQRKGPGNSMYGKNRYVPKEQILHMVEINKRAILNLDTGELFDSVKSAAIFYGADASGISKCCKGKRKLAGGFHWAYADDNTMIMRYNQAKNLGIHFLPNCRCIINVDTGEHFESVTLAAERYGVSISSISSCLRGKKPSAAGFRWAYYTPANTTPAE